MNLDVRPPNLQTLRGRIDLRRATFSDRGSRLVISESNDLPGLQIKLAERFTGIEPGLGTYLERLPFIEQLQFIDQGGTPLEYETISYPHAIFFRTRIGAFGLAFQDEHTVSIGLPHGAQGGIRLLVRPGVQHRYENGGDFRAIRDLAYSTNGTILAHRVMVDEEAHEVEVMIDAGTDIAIALQIAESNVLSRCVKPFSEVYAAAEARWHAWFEAVPPVRERYHSQYLYAWWVMGNNTVSPRGLIHYEAMMPSKSHYVGVWQWDAFFHALAYRHAHPQLAADQFQVMFDHQLPDGMLPDAIYDEGIVTELDHPIPGTVTKPPIAAWAALKVYRRTGDRQFIEALYGPLVRLFNWWFGANDDDGDGLAQYNHPYSSGLDDNPIFDYGMPVESPDLNTYLSLAADALAEIADTIGRQAEAVRWRTRAASLVRRMIEDMYDPDAGLFWVTRDGKPVRVVTPFNLYPLLTGRLPGDIASRLVDHLKNPAEFWTQYPLPTVATNDPHHAPHTMWRGPVWININHFFVDGLLRAGYPNLARELRERTLELVMSQQGIYEYYHPQTGEPPTKTAYNFGWSAACFIDLAIQASEDQLGD